MPNFINTSIVASGKDYGEKRKVKEIGNCYMGGTGHFFFFLYICNCYSTTALLFKIEPSHR